MKKEFIIGEHIIHNKFGEGKIEGFHEDNGTKVHWKNGNYSFVCATELKRKELFDPEDTTGIIKHLQIKVQRLKEENDNLILENEKLRKILI